MIEIEVSPWSFDPDIRAVLSWSRLNVVPVLCYSLLGRGFLSGEYVHPTDIRTSDFRRHLPRFRGAAFYQIGGIAVEF